MANRLTAAQRQEAWRKSAWVRGQRKLLRGLLKAGDVDPWELLRGVSGEWEPVICDMGLERFLMLVPGVGEVTVDETVAHFRLRRSDKLRSLSYGQRAAIADKLRAAFADEPVEPPPALAP